MAKREYKQQDAVQPKCPNCGAPLKFDPASGNLRCEHCQSIIQFDKVNGVAERDFADMVTFNVWKDTDVTCYRCADCGATSVLPRTTLATTCPYCGSPVVVQDKTGSLVKPDTVVPFELTRKQAAEQLALWRKRKYLAPRKFKKNTREESIKGVYIPVWTFDAETTAEYQGRLGKRRTRTVHVNGKSHTETYIEWFSVSGTWSANFNDIAIRGNDNVTEEDFRKLQPYAESKYMAFDDEYLAGYIADHYTVEPQEAFRLAKNKMCVNIRQQIVDYYNADVEGNLELDLHILSKSFKYMLAPIYIAATKYGRKLYRQYVSGIFCDADRKKSRVSGKAPISRWKVFFLVLLGLGLIAGIVYLILSNSGNFSVDYDWFSLVDNFRLK